MAFSSDMPINLADHRTPQLDEIERSRPRRKTIAERVITAREVGPPLEEPPYLWGPYLNVGASHWLTGQTGLGKTTFCYNLASALSEGRDLWDIPCKRQRVLYLDMESGQVGRSEKMARLYPEDKPSDDWLIATEPISLPAELPDFIAFVKEKGVNLVVFDTVRRCFKVRDENDNAEVYNSIVPTLDCLKQVGVASLVLGHPSKNGNSGARGAGAQEDAGDINLTLTMHRGEVNDPKGVIKLTVTKNRLLGLGISPLLLERDSERIDHFKRVRAEIAEKQFEQPPRSREICDEAIMTLVHEQNGQPIRHSEIVKRLIQSNIPSGTVKGRITALQSQGKIAHDLSGGYILGDSARSKDLT